MWDSMRILIVLMWKHMVVRRRKYINTTMEFLLTFLLVFIIHVVQKKVFTVESNAMAQWKQFLPNSTLRTTPSYMLDDSTIGPDRVLYAPINNFTQRLMASVGKKLELDPVEKFRGYSQKGYKGYNNELELRNQSLETPYGAMVIFKNSTETMPEHLQYTIRIAEDYMTNIFRALGNKRAEPHENFGTIYEPFMRLQWSIDTSFLELQSGHPLNLSLLLRELPSKTEFPKEVMMASFVSTICFMALILSFLNMITTASSDRTSGILELIKMSGATTMVIYTAYVLNALLMGIPFAVISTYLVTSGDEIETIVPHFYPFMVFVFLLLYFLSVVLFGLIVAGFLTESNHALVIGSILYFISYIVTLIVTTAFENSPNAMTFSMLLPHVAMNMFFVSAVYFEEEIIWSEPYYLGGVSLLTMYFFSFIQVAMYFLIAWYMQKVHPGQYGVALPFNFLLKKDYWKPGAHKVTPEDLELEEIGKDQDPMYFEEIPAGQEIAIKIVNVSKVYKTIGKPPFRALHNINLNVISNEITVLLGHNGAGKTTLMNIITGMHSATSGEVYVHGLHSVRDQSEIRKIIGYCPQHNLLFKDLSVNEHVIFFAMLRGVLWGPARAAAFRLIGELGLSHRARHLPKALSGGMLRRLQIACALAGNSTVLLLDEPTSALDVHTRREIWDLLLGMRGRVSLLVSTHFLEEADALGARCCALAAGVLRCHASPMHLKRVVGEGYYLTLGGGSARLAGALAALSPGARLHRAAPRAVTYSLPATDAAQLPQLFRQLEARRDELGIESMGVSAPSLDQVFLKLCCEGDAVEYSEVDGQTELIDPKRVTGLRLCWRQFAALLKRHCLFQWQKKFNFLFLNVLAPIIVLGFLCIGFNAHPPPSRTSTSNPPLRMGLQMYLDLPNRNILVNLNENYTQSFRRSNPDSNFQFASTEDVYEEAKRSVKKTRKAYEKNLLGLDIGNGTAQVYYTTAFRHTAPVGINLLTNLLAQQTRRDDNRLSITTINHPLTPFADNSSASPNIVAPKDRIIICVQMSYVTLLVLASVPFGIMIILVEEAGKTRYNYYRAGASVHMYWLTTLLFHTMLFCVFLLPGIVFMVTMTDTDNTLKETTFAGALSLILIIGAVCTLAFQYLITTSCRRVYMLYFSALFVCCLILPLFLQNARLNQLTHPEQDLTSFYWITKTIGFPFPMLHMALAVSNAGYIARLNAYCRAYHAACPRIPAPDPGFDAERCCASEGAYQSYFDSFGMSPKNDMFILIFLTFFYMILLILLERGTLHSIIARFTRPQRPLVSYEDERDEQVVKERQYVIEQTRNIDKKKMVDALLVNNIFKTYRKCCHPVTIGVQDISFSVKKNECFGVLGVNGAGKSTLFNMIAGEIPPTQGEIYANGYSLHEDRTKYMRGVAYCRQSGGLEPFLTARQQLRLLMTLRGFDARSVNHDADMWLDIVGLSSAARVRSARYSGGMRRRLAAAAALCVRAPLVLLDEPSAGVDVAARRRLWAAVRRALARTAAAVLLTSHSMEELEALCARLLVARRGRAAALGGAAELRARHARGHAAALRLQAFPHVSAEERLGLINALKTDFQTQFNSTLKMEHVSQLDYHINETLSYSEIFTKMEALKQKHPIMADYSVNETTLEEVFLAFAKDQENAPNQ